MSSFLRRIFVFATTFLLSFSALAPFTAQAISPETQFLIDQNILEKGVTEIALNTPLTRADWVQWVLKEEGFSAQKTKSEPFRDVSNNPYVAEAWQRQAVKTGVKFYPERPITAAEALKILFKLENIPVSTTVSAQQKWTDFPADKELQSILFQAVQSGLWTPVSPTEFGTAQRLTVADGVELLKAFTALNLPKPDTATFRVDFSSPAEIQKQSEQEKYDYIWQQLHKNFLYQEKLDDNKMMEESIKGMVDALGDKYTQYLAAPERDAFEEQFTGEIEGVGAEITLPENEEKGVVISRIFPGTPAEKSGLQKGDVLLEIDGKDISHFIPKDAGPLIRGSAGTTVKIRFSRNGIEQDLSITRAKIQIHFVEARRDGDILVLHVLTFGQNTASEFQAALQDNMKDPALKGIVVDLRDNPGGDLDVTEQMLGMLLPAHSTAAWLAKNGDTLKQEVVAAKTPYLEMPLVVLVNKDSASASEIFAAAIQDYKRGKIVGTTTFGKGVAQDYEQFSDGSALKYTSHYWLTPKKNSIQGVGLTPDFPVVESADTLGGTDKILEVGENVIHRDQAKPVLPLTLDTGK